MVIEGITVATFTIALAMLLFAEIIGDKGMDTIDILISVFETANVLRTAALCALFSVIVSILKLLF